MCQRSVIFCKARCDKEIRKRLAGRAAEYMMLKGDEEENAKTTAEVSSSGNVIVFPDFEKLKNV